MMPKINDVMYTYRNGKKVKCIVTNIWDENNFHSAGFRVNLIDSSTGMVFSELDVEHNVFYD